jgi:phospholipid/cholesterol/gamma-HCH transport system substrate-binding protein
VLTVWAFQNVLRFDWVERPYTLTAEFSSSPGLHPNFEVDYLGIQVGKVDSVRLADRKVVVKLDIYRGTEIPRGVRAAAVRKSAIGEPAVELTPAPGQGRAPAMEPGSVIPLSRTSVPATYGSLFGSVNEAVRALDPNDMRVLTEEMARGWEGRAGSLREIIGGADQLTSTFAQNTELLDGLTRDLGSITQVLAENRGELGQGVDALADVTGSLRTVRGDLAGIRERGPQLTGRVNALLDRSDADIDCSLSALGDFFPAVTTPKGLADLRQTLAGAPRLAEALNGVLGNDKTLHIVFLLTLNTKAAEEYRFPLPQPKAKCIPACPDGHVPVTGPANKAKGEKPGDTIPTHDPSLNTKPASAPGREPLPTLPPIIAALAVAAVTGAHLWVWRRLRS